MNLLLREEIVLGKASLNITRLLLAGLFTLLCHLLSLKFQPRTLQASSPFSLSVLIFIKFIYIRGKKVKRKNP